MKRTLQAVILIAALVSAYWAGYRTRTYQHPYVHDLCPNQVDDYGINTH